MTPRALPAFAQRVAIGIGCAIAALVIEAHAGSGTLPPALPGSSIGQSPFPIMAEPLHPALPADVVRTAHRLHVRLRKHGGSPPLTALATAILRRRELLRSSVLVTFESPQPALPSIVWNARTAQYPHWIGVRRTPTTLTFFVDPQMVRNTLVRERIGDLPAPEDVTITEISQVGSVRRAVTDGIARTGYTLDLDATVPAVVALLERGTGSIALPILERPGRIVNATGEDLGDLTLLSTGMSNFRGSPWGRIKNVRKALREHLNNVLVAPGETFSFNDALGGPVTYRNGWVDSKVIFNGTELRDAPGGGICQASTTVFRAILQAGLPVLEQKNHSLYVSYYELYGVGIDATVFPGKQDLTFVNDTGHHLLIQAFDDGNDAYVTVYGTDDGRTVDLQGPFFSGTAPADLLVDGRPLRTNEIGWLRTVTMPDGSVRKDPFISRYKAVPRSVVQKYGISTAQL